jgi:hypothetical protein
VIGTDCTGKSNYFKNSKYLFVNCSFIVSTSIVSSRNESQSLSEIALLRDEKSASL